MMQRFPVARKINKTHVGKFMCSVRGSNTAVKCGHTVQLTSQCILLIHIEKLLSELFSAALCIEAPTFQFRQRQDVMAASCPEKPQKKKKKKRA